MQHALPDSEAVLWSVAASRTTNNSSIFARPAYLVPGGAFPHIVSIAPLQCMSGGGMLAGMVSVF
jgi:hypothetical protein